MKKLKIGICGWGTVATALYKCIETNSEYIQQKENLDIEVVVIGARRDNPDCDPKGTNVERDIYNVLNHDIDVLIELIGGISDAKKLISAAMEKGFHVVTANKAVIFSHGDELRSIAANKKVHLLFEASVCAGTPIIDLLENHLSGNKISSVKGMLNGTTNFILSEMEEGKSFDSSLDFAKRSGYAEADPSFDIDGIDAAHKIAILSSLVFNTPLPPSDFFIEGITNINSEVVHAAESIGFSIKHIASASRENGNVFIRSNPALVKKDSYFSNLKNVRNGLEVETEMIGSLNLSGSGAGGDATAAGVIADLLRISREKPRHCISNKLPKLKEKSIQDMDFCFFFLLSCKKHSDTTKLLSKIQELDFDLENLTLRNFDSKHQIYFTTSKINMIKQIELESTLKNLGFQITNIMRIET